MDSLQKALQNIAVGETESRRLLHGRGHCFAGLEAVNVDYFPPLLFITLYQPQPDELLQQIEVLARGNAAVECLMIQHRYQPQSPTQTVFGGVVEPFVITEAGLSYQIYPGQRQNIGFFLDMARGREWVRDEAQGKRVLNLFAFTCAFSVAAIKGGAEQVVNLDMSGPALSRGRENHRLNQHDLSKVQFLPYDLFKSWGRVKRQGPYDLVIIDPPSFQRGSFVASKDYQRVLRRLGELLSPRAKVLLCLNDPNIDSEFLIAGMKEYCPDARLLERLPVPDSFPEKEPEKGLKTLIFAFDG